MTSRHLDCDNWQDAKESIMLKYDKNGDGKLDGSKVGGFVDEYMSTLHKQQSLANVTKTQSKVIYITVIMIILLSVSNLGTAFLAANLAKDIRIIDGRMVSNDGTKSAIATRRSVKAFSVVGVEDMGLPADRRLEDDYETTIACYTDDEAKEIYNTVVEEGRVNLVVRDPREPAAERVVPVNGEAQRRMLDISRKLQSRDSGEGSTFTIMYEFPDSRVRFVPEDFDCVMRLVDDAESVDPEPRTLRTVGVQRRLL